MTWTVVDLDFKVWLVFCLCLFCFNLTLQRPNSPSSSSVISCLMLRFYWDRISKVWFQRFDLAALEISLLFLVSAALSPQILRGLFLVFFLLCRGFDLLWSWHPPPPIGKCQLKFQAWNGDFSSDFSSSLESSHLKPACSPGNRRGGPDSWPSGGRTDCWVCFFLWGLSERLLFFFLLICTLNDFIAGTKADESTSIVTDSDSAGVWWNYHCWHWWWCLESSMMVMQWWSCLFTLDGFGFDLISSFGWYLRSRIWVSWAHGEFKLLEWDRMWHHPYGGTAAQEA